MVREKQADTSNLIEGDDAARRPAKTLYYTLDGIRGVAALLVVLRHTQPFFGAWQSQESYLAVDVFFVLSGVVLAQAYGNRLATGTMSFREFAGIRVVRIWPLYLLGTAISVIAACAGLMNFGPPHLLAYFTVLALFMIPNPGIGTIDVFPLNNPAWSLSLELAVNAAYAVLIKRLNTVRLVFTLAASAIGIALTLYAAKSHRLNFGFWAKSFPFGIFRVAFSFFAGVLLFRYKSAFAMVWGGGGLPAMWRHAWCSSPPLPSSPRIPPRAGSRSSISLP